MSNHCSTKSLLLHHYQADAGKIRRQQKAEGRHESFLLGRAKARQEYHCVLVFAFICFAYVNIATAVYLGHMI